ncbi:MAG TPA: ATP-binding cassette domain-containing protein [Longimicrobiales bacterium]|nr:ATP-binding cassette domain-containing protein [Longimicrobiales bacterium]
MGLDSAPALELSGVAKSYDSFQAVKPLDLVVPRGATYGLLGPNGAGKTTTIRMIMRILPPDGGEIRVLGQPLAQKGLDRIGYLPEERGVYKRMKVRALLSFFGELKGVRPRDTRARIDRWLERLDLLDRAEAPLQELSKGMQQKVQFIGSIVHEPDIVILDEPFSGLDPINQRVLREIIDELRTEGRTLIFSTHIIEHAERLCDHVCIIARGTKVADGSLAEVKRRHGSEYVRIRVAGSSAELAQRLKQTGLVEQIREHGSEVEVGLADGADPQRLLEELVASGIPVRRFEVAEPSLEQVFIERVGGVQPAAEAIHV